MHKEEPMRRTGSFWLGVAAVILVLSGCSKTERTKPPSSEPPGAQPGAVGTGGAGADVRSDSEFVRDVALKNTMEIELSRLAADKATTPQIKAFAQQMIADHGRAGEELKHAVTGQPIEWPARLDEDHRKRVEDLTKEHGTDFDRLYVKAMIEAHQDFTAKLEARLDVQSLADWKTTAAGRTQANALPEPRTAMRDVPLRPARSDNAVTMKINQWAAETYPIAQQHLDAARTLENVTKKQPSR
jgi:putative membrane protein